MSLAEFREDGNRWAEGSPIHINEMTFYVRRWGTPESQEKLRDIRKRLFGPFHKQQDSDDDIVMGEWLTEYGVTGWENVYEERSSALKAIGFKPKEVRYSKKNARGIFCNPEFFYSLNRLLYANAANFENYLYQEAEEDTEELKKP